MRLLKLQGLLINTAAAFRDNGKGVLRTGLLTNLDALRAGALTGQGNGTKAAANSDNLLRLAGPALNAHISRPRDHRRGTDNNTGNTNKSPDQCRIQRPDRHWLGGRVDLDLEISKRVFDSVVGQFTNLASKFARCVFKLGIYDGMVIRRPVPNSKCQ